MSIHQKIIITLLTIIAILSFAYSWSIVIKRRTPNIYDPDNYPAYNQLCQES